jgi:aspartate carbamoyltransferase catalytic subunit
MKTMGASVAVCGPKTLMPLDVEAFGVDVYSRLDEAISDADVIYALRIQKERQGGGLFPSIREYHQLYGITMERLKMARKDAIIMHPGPINRGIELAFDVADSERSVILEQVTNGVAVRMAILYLLSGREAREE